MKIAVYAFDGITMFHLAAPLIVFETASSLGLAPEWRTTVWTTDGRSIRTSEGLVMDDLARPGDDRRCRPARVPLLAHRAPAAG